MITEEAIKDAFYHLSQAREDLYKAAGRDAFCKKVLEEANFGHILAGRIDGKNEQQRESQLWDLGKDFKEAYYQACLETKRAQIEYDCASYLTKEISMIIQLQKEV